MSTLYQQFLQTIIPILPETVMISTALLVLLFDLFIEKDRKYTLGWFSVIGIIGAAIATYKLMGVNAVFFAGTFHLDAFSTFFKFVFYIACGLGILVSINYLKIEDIHRGEYYALMLFATSGYDAYGVGRGPDCTLCRSRTHGPVHIHPCGFYARNEPVERGSDQISILGASPRPLWSMACRCYTGFQAQRTSPGSWCTCAVQTLPIRSFLYPCSCWS